MFSRGEILLQNPQIGAAAIVAVPLPFYFIAWIFAIFHSVEAVLILAMICWIFGLVWWTAFAYVHFMWVKPSRHLLLGLQQVDLAPLKDQPAYNVLTSSLPLSSCPGCLQPSSIPCHLHGFASATCTKVQKPIPTRRPFGQT